MIEFQIPDMSCGHCAARITQAIRAIAPEAHLQFDLPARRVVLETDADRETLAAALTQAGYPPAAA